MVKLLKLILRPAMNENGFIQAATAFAGLSALAAAVGTGYSIYASERQRAMAKKAREEYQREQRAAAKKMLQEEQRLKRIEEEKRDRLRRKGSELPASILTSYAGLPGLSGKSNILGGA